MFDSLNDSSGPDLDMNGPGLCGGDYDFFDGDVCSYDFGDSFDSADYGDCVSSNDSKGPARFARVGFDEQAGTYAVHIVGHGKPDFLGWLENFTGSTDLVRVPWIRTGGRDLKRQYKELMPLSTWSSKAGKDSMGAGHYGGATGTTDVLRQYYCVGVKSFALTPWGGQPQWDRNAKAFIEVTAVTWRYREAGDYESRILIRVITLPEYRVHEACYRQAKCSPVAALNRKAKELRGKFFSALRSCSPTAAARVFRENPVSVVVDDNETGVGIDNCVAAAAETEDRPYGMGVVLMPV